MIIAILSVLVFTVTIWALNKKLPVQICPICAGVTLTWVWMLYGMWSGILSVPKYEFITAIFMGASVGGIVAELKKLFLKLKNKTGNTQIETIKKQLDNCC